MSQGGGFTIYFCQPIPICNPDVCVIDCRCGTPAECDQELKKLGIIVGCIFCMLLLIIVISSIFAFLRYRRNKKLAVESRQQEANSEQENRVPDVPNSRKAQPMDTADYDKQNSTNIESSCHEEEKNCDKLELKYCQI